MAISPERAHVIFSAVLCNLDTWIEQLREIELHANIGNKSRILHLMIGMEMARKTLEKMINEPIN
jgi:hypothetical protein